jgi:hypothetical protein
MFSGSVPAESLVNGPSFDVAQGIDRGGAIVG